MPDNPPSDRHKMNEMSSPNLAAIMQIVMRIGVLMLRSGTVSFRVEQAMSRAAVALAAERLDAYVTLAGIMASIHCGDRHYTQIARIKNIGVDMNRLSAVEHLSQTIPLHSSPASVTQVLDKIEAHRNRESRQAARPERADRRQPLLALYAVLRR